MGSDKEITEANEQKVRKLWEERNSSGTYLEGNMCRREGARHVMRNPGDFGLVSEEEYKALEREFLDFKSKVDYVQFSRSEKEYNQWRESLDRYLSL